MTVVSCITNQDIQKLMYINYMSDVEPHFLNENLLQPIFRGRGAAAVR